MMRTLFTTAIVFLLLQGGMCSVVQAAVRSSHAAPHEASSMVMPQATTHDHAAHPCCPKDQGQPSPAQEHCCAGSVVPSFFALDGEFHPIGGAGILAQTPVIYPGTFVATPVFIPHHRPAQYTSVDLRILYASFLN